METAAAKSQNSPYRYASDPLAFVHDCFDFPRGQAPAPYQDEILAELPKRKRVAVRGPHGLGKTAMASWIVLWAVLTSEEVKVPTTASAWRQLTKFLWPEIHKWARRIRWGKLDRGPLSRWELLGLSLKPRPNCEAFAVASDNPELIEGAHAERIVYVFDEAKAIPDGTWDAAEGAFSIGDCYAVAISTPGDRSGRFYDIHRRAPGYEDWWTRHVTLEEAIAAKRMTREWADARRKQWGEESPVYQARVLGEFPEQSEDTLVSLAWIEAARERELVPADTDDHCLGLDVARFGDDDSALIERHGPCAMDGETWHGHDTMQTAGRAQAKRLHVNVDVIGIGSGVFDRLRELKRPCSPINVGEAAKDGEHFENLRAELFWALRDRFREGNIDLSRLPREIYDRLSGELTSIKFAYTSSGKLKLEAKADMKKRLGHSPDLADALALAYASPGVRLSEIGSVGAAPSRWELGETKDRDEPRGRDKHRDEPKSPWQLK